MTTQVWSMSDEHGILTAEQAEARLIEMVTSSDLAQQEWDALSELDHALHVTPRLLWLLCVNNRDALMASEQWDGLSDDLRAWVIWVDEADIDGMTRAVVTAVTSRYCDCEGDDQHE